MQVQRIRGEALNRSFLLQLGVYLTAMTALAFASVWLGLVVPLPRAWDCGIGAENASQLHTGCILANRYAWSVRLGVMAVFILPILKLVSMLTGCSTIRDLLTDMMSPDNNDSPAILVLGIGAAVGIGGVFIPYNDLGNFLINFGLRISMTGFVALAVTIVLMRFGFRIRTYNAYVEAINRSGTNALSYWTVFVYLSTAAIICASRT